MKPHFYDGYGTHKPIIAWVGALTHAYIHEPETVREEVVGFIGAEIVSAECERVESEDIGGDVRDIHFYKLNTTKGTLVITLYAEHNGYYGGWLQYEA